MNSPMVTYGINSGVHEPTDFMATIFREKIKNRGLSFRSYNEEITPKISIDEFEKLIKTILIQDNPGYLIEHHDVDSITTEISLHVPRDGAREDFSADTDLVRVYLESGELPEYNEWSDNYDIGSLSEAILVRMQVQGSHDHVEKFRKHFREALTALHKVSKTSLVRWVFDDSHGSRDRTFQIKKTWELQDSFYPWISGGVRNYYQRFIDSQAQILVMYGPPGTGKTSFLRDLVCEMNLNTFISYDLKILTADATFVRYLTDPIFNAIVIEDADDLLTGSRGEHNKIIAKILNISDGLIKLPKKKLILTTNLPKVSDMDQAIIRPGRCFDVLEFKTLTREEAEAVATDLNIELVDKSKYTLAELFHQKNMSVNDDPLLKRREALKTKNSIGFV